MTEPGLTEWGDRQLAISAGLMAQNVSAISLVMERRGFGQTVRPAKGAVLAASGRALSEDEPDYFFHWLRDSATVMDAARVLIGLSKDAESWRERFADFVRFSLDLQTISGPRFLREVDFRTPTAPDLQQFLRPDDEIAAVDGERVLDEVRYNADGTLDFLRWSRPQFDGAAARALTVLRYWEAGLVEDDLHTDVERLLQLDLDYTVKRSGEPCIDIWEEEHALHYYTCLVQLAALRKGADWARAGNDVERASQMETAAAALEARLDRFWSAEEGLYRSRILPGGEATAKALDFAVILGVLHAGLDTGRHSVADERVASTFDRLQTHFAADFAINRQAGEGLAFGRYPGDAYFDGGAWFLCTFGAAEFCYRRAAMSGDAALLASGDRMLGMARRFIPRTGDISEQFDKTTGEQRSARNLTWSHAAFIVAWQARQDALEAAGKAEDNG